MFQRLVQIVYSWIFPPEWEVVITLWPYPEGYGTYNRRKRTLLDAGLQKDHAYQVCEELNSRKSKRVRG